MMKIVQGGTVSKLLAGVAIPKMFRASQKFPRESISPSDIPAKIFAELSREPFISKIKSGMQIAITAGSRGVANVAVITKAIADFVKSRDATPFIVPAMGSHGGATAEGQLEVLEGYGITPVQWVVRFAQAWRLCIWDSPTPGRMFTLTATPTSLTG